MIKRYAFVIYYFVCALGGIWALIALQNSGAIFNVSKISQPSVLSTAIPWMLAVLLIGLFLSLAVIEWRTSSHNKSITGAWLSHPAWITGAFLFLLIFFVFFYIFVLSPVRRERLYVSFLVYQPIYIWIGVAILSFFCLAFLVRGPRYWFAAWKEMLGSPYVQTTWRWLNSPAAGIVLLIISLLIGLTKQYFGLFVDEADNMYVGWLISKGFVLYRDVFSHHFPFPYYWTALVALFFGNSFVAMRLSVLFLQIVLFAVAMKVTGFYLTLGLTSLIWNLINQFHRGQEALYQTFEGLFLVISFIIIFSWLIKHNKPGYITMALAGVLLGLALASDPLAIYPISIAMLGVFASGLTFRDEYNRSEDRGDPRAALRWREGLRRILAVGLPAAVVVCIFLINLIVSGTVNDFYRSAIWFNAEVYSKYVEHTSPNQVGNILSNVTSGLDVLNPRWVAKTSPFFPLEPLRSDRLDNEDAYYTWIFSSFLFRISILVCALGLLLNRKYLAGIFLYLFAAAILLRLSTYFYAIGFTLLSVFAACFLLTHLRSPTIISSKTDDLKSGGDNHKLPGWARQSLLITWSALFILIGGMFLWTSFRGAYFLRYNVNVQKDKAEYLIWERLGDKMRDLGCGQPVEIGVYGRNSIVYFASGLLPATKYTFMNPWVAEISQQEIISVLSHHPSAVVWLNSGKKKGTDEGITSYLPELINFLDENYVYKGNNLMVSPALAARCATK